MPDVPDPDFVGALCEIWFAINYAAYHLAYIRVYLQTASLQTHVDQIRKEEQAFRDASQTDLIVCRAHLAAFFWQVDHVFEALRIAVNRGQKEHADLKYFWSWGKSLEKIEASAIHKEINAYRNKSHGLPAVIGCKWEDKGNGPELFITFCRPLLGMKRRKKSTSRTNYRSISSLRQMSGYPSRRVITRRSFHGVSSLPLRSPILFSGSCPRN